VNGLSAAAVALVGASLVGCAPEPYAQNIEGRITEHGAPLGSVRVKLVSAQGDELCGRADGETTTGIDGTFHMRL
jgi:hypothetical protein